VAKGQFARSQGLATGDWPLGSPLDFPFLELPRLWSPPESAPVKSLRFLAAAALCFRLAAADPAVDMADAATRFVAALSDEQRAKATFVWSDDERLNWHFVPKERKGVQLRELGVAQQHLAQGLLGSALSQRGLLKATTIMSLEQVLQDIEGPKRTFPRDPGMYHVSIFGTPGPKGTWGWRFEGHHLSFNFTIVDGKVAAGTPAMMGTNPAEIRQGPRAGLRTLAAEEDLGRELITSLPEALRTKALYDQKAPDDILTVAQRKAKLEDKRGVTLGEMPAAQRELAIRLMREYLGRLRPEIADADFAKIEKAGLDQVLFAWAGSLQKGDRHYYRILGPTFLLEYDNTQNNANHVHAVWRNFENDFGLDVLAEHLKNGHGR
jgi:hypothetical protein